MQPGEYDYTVEGGDCLALHVVLKDSTGATIDLTGYTSEVVFVWSEGELHLSSGDRLEMAEAGESPMTDAGSITGTVTAAETVEFPEGRLTRYEWSIVNPSGCKQTFLRGFVNRL